METTGLIDTEKVFADAFDKFQKSAFRLERLQTYDVEEERELFRKFLKEGAAKSCPPEFEDGCKQIARATAQGRLFQRVRRISFPLNDYTRFEMLNGYRFCIEAGERVRILEGPDAISNLVGTLGEIKDFWLFDDNLCFELEYDEQGQFVAVHQVEISKLPFYVTAKSKLWQASVELGKSKAWKLVWTPQTP